MFVDFKGYVNFFFLNDLVTEDCGAVKFWDGWKDFSNNPIPETVDRYLEFLQNELTFVEARNSRISISIKCFIK